MSKNFPLRAHNLTGGPKNFAMHTTKSNGHVCKLTFRHDGIDRRLTDVHGDVITEIVTT